MRKVIMAVGFCVGITGCAGTNPTDVTNAEICALDLLQTGLTDPAALAQAALTDSACKALAADVVTNIINQIPTRAAAMKARGLR